MDPSCQETEDLMHLHNSSLTQSPQTSILNSYWSFFYCRATQLRLFLSKNVNKYFKWSIKWTPSPTSNGMSATNCICTNNRSTVILCNYICDVWYMHVIFMVHAWIKVIFQNHKKILSCFVSLINGDPKVVLTDSTDKFYLPI